MIIKRRKNSQQASKRRVRVCRRAAEEGKTLCAPTPGGAVPSGRWAAVASSEPEGGSGAAADRWSVLVRRKQSIMEYYGEKMLLEF